MNVLTDKIKFNEKDFIDFLVAEGITVKTNTKARGHLGICYKNRIDVSVKAKPERRIAVLAHEYAHKVHLNVEQDSFTNGGSLQALFNTKDITNIKNELMRVTHFVDEQSLFIELNKKRETLKQEILTLEAEVKTGYPDFKRSYEFKEIKTYFKKNKSKANYLLKYDRVKLIHPVWRKEEFFCIQDIDKDFPKIPSSLRAYIKLNSLMRKRKKISSRINKAKQYYNRPTELFARFIEGLFIDKQTTIKIAPNTYEQFMFLLKNDHYGALKNLLQMAGIV